MLLRVASRRFTGTVNLHDGRIVVPGTSAYLQRLCGLTVAAFRNYAAGRGWRMQELRDAVREDSVPDEHKSGGGRR